MEIFLVFFFGNFFPAFSVRGVFFEDFSLWVFYVFYLSFFFLQSFERNSFSFEFLLLSTFAEIFYSDSIVFCAVSTLISSNGFVLSFTFTVNELIAHREKQAIHVNPRCFHWRQELESKVRSSLKLRAQRGTIQFHLKTCGKFMMLHRVALTCCHNDTIRRVASVVFLVTSLLYTIRDG